ncbi:MAG: hypothetical protein AAGI51_05195 [Pseudomonadota bacterium]
MTDLPAEITIARRFRGPLHSANGGYVCGVIAAPLGAAATVTLRNPPPLDRPLRLVPRGEGAALMDGETLLGAGEAHADWLDAHPQDAAPAVSVEAARAASARSPYADGGHPLPECFVCGPDRAPQDGLRILSGPFGAAAAETAAIWTPHPAFGDAEGRVRAEFLWSALDCPSGHAISASDPELADTPILLGCLAARIEARPPVGAPLVVTARFVARDGRKLTAVSAVHDAEGRRLARARALWITVPKAALYAERP